MPDIYEKYLNVLVANTGGPRLPVLTRKTSVDITYARSRKSGGNIEDHIQKALNENHIIIKMDEEGDVRISPTIAGVEYSNHLYPYTEENIERIEEIITEEKESSSPSEDIIKWGNQHLSKIESRNNK